MTCGSLVFFFKDTATTEIYPLSRHDALPIFALGRRAVEARPPPAPPTADGRAGALGREGLERVFEAVSLGVDAAGEGADRRFLARLALLLAREVGDPERALALVAAAASEGTAG